MASYSGPTGTKPGRKDAMERLKKAAKPWPPQYVPAQRTTK